MSEPNMGLVVLGPVLGPADHEVSPVSDHAVHLLTRGRKSEPNSSHEMKKCKTQRREGMKPVLSAITQCIPTPKGASQSQSPPMQ